MISKYRLVIPRSNISVGCTFLFDASSDKEAIKTAVQYAKHFGIIIDETVVLQRVVVEEKVTFIAIPKSKIKNANLK